MRKTRLTKVLALTLVLLIVMSSTVFGVTGRVISNTLTGNILVEQRGAFGVNAVTTKAHNGVDGYIVDIRLIDGVSFKNANVVVSLYDKNNNIMQVNTLLDSSRLTDTNTSLTSPFDVKGTYSYVGDGWWKVGTESAYGNYADPGKIVIDVTLANGKILTDTLTNITPVEKPGAFGVNAVTTKAHNGVDGYIVDIRLIDGVSFKNADVIVSLYDKDNNIMQVNTLLDSSRLTDASTSLTSPFDVKGTYSYVSDGWWKVGTESAHGNYADPGKIVIDVTLANGKTLTDTLTNITPVEKPGAFGVNAVTTKAHNGVDGYIVDVRLTDSVTFEGASAVISLLDESGNIMQSNALPTTHTWKATSLTVPFDVQGTYDYSHPTWSDGIMWNVQGSVKGNYNVPAKVVIDVTLASGKELHAELTGIVGVVNPVDYIKLTGEVDDQSFVNNTVSIDTVEGQSVVININAQVQHDLFDIGKLIVKVDNNLIDIGDNIIESNNMEVQTFTITLDNLVAGTHTVVIYVEEGIVQ